MDNLDLMCERLGVNGAEWEHTSMDNLDLMRKRIRGSNS